MSDETPESDDEDSDPKPKAKGKAKAKKKLLPRHWLEIVNMARSGVPVATIASTFKVSIHAIYGGLKKRGVVIGAYANSSREFDEGKQRRELIERVRDTKDKDYRYTEFIQRQSIKLLMDAQKEGRSIATVGEDIKALKAAMDVIRIGTDNKWRILGLDKENEDADKELPELPIRDMTPAEIEAERDKQLMDDATLEELEAAAQANAEDDDDEGDDGDDEDDDDEPAS